MQRKKHGLLVYRDKGGINKKIGVAAIGPTCNQNIFFNSFYSFTIYSKELYVIVSATEKYFKTYTKPQKVIICIESQIAMKAVRTIKNKSD